MIKIDIKDLHVNSKISFNGFSNWGKPMIKTGTVTIIYPEEGYCRVMTAKYEKSVQFEDIRKIW